MLEGNLPSVLDPPQGCPFCTRCPRKIGDICDDERPPLLRDSDNHVIACHIPLEELREVEPVIKVPSELEKRRALLLKEAQVVKMQAEAAAAEAIAAEAKAKVAAAEAAAAELRLDAATEEVEQEGQ